MKNAKVEIEEIRKTGLFSYVVNDDLDTAFKDFVIEI